MTTARECLILGGGPAGSMAGLLFARSGRTTTVIEKEKSAHHKVCGEFLSPEAVSYLANAGINATSLGAVPIHILRLSAGERTVETKLPFTALSLSRHILDEALLLRAAEEGCTVCRGLVVDKLTRDAGAWTARLVNGEEISAPTAFLATGKHDLRGWPRSQGLQSNLVGFKLHWRLAPAQIAELRDAMELYLFPGGYGGLSLVENEVANLCLVIRKPVLRKLGGWPALLAGLLAGNRRMRHLLHQAHPLWDRPLAVASIPYGHLGSLYATRGLWPLGDQAAVIPSFTGDGMSIALHSAALAAATYLAGASPADYEHALALQLRRGMRLATALSIVSIQTLPRVAAPFALSLFPHMMSWIANATRIPSSALTSALRCDSNPGPLVPSP
jgi:flavin-dependent dehydrogenase